MKSIVVKIKTSGTLGIDDIYRALSGYCGICRDSKAKVREYKPRKRYCRCGGVAYMKDYNYCPYCGGVIQARKAVKDTK